MHRGYALKSRRSAVSGQVEALEAAGVTVIYVDEGKKTDAFADLLSSLRRGDALSVVKFSDLASNRADLQERLKAIHAKGCYVEEVSTGRDSRDLNDTADMIFEAADTLGQNRKGHDPKTARKYGMRGGRPRKDRGISDEDAEKHWFDSRHASNEDALKHMGAWDGQAAWRKWGPSGRKSGPRPKTEKD